MLSNTPLADDIRLLTDSGNESHSCASIGDIEKVREDGLVREADPEVMRQLYGRTDHVLSRALRGEKGADEGKGAGAS